jgi:hypothetical protein
MEIIPHIPGNARPRVVDPIGSVIGALSVRNKDCDQGRTHNRM